MLAEQALNDAMERMVTPPLMKRLEPLLTRHPSPDIISDIVVQHSDAAGFRYNWQKQALVSAITAHIVLLQRLHTDIAWKTLIQIQQRQSEIAQIVRDMDRSRARDVRRWWFTMIEVIVLVKKGSGAGPLSLGPFARLHIAWQTTFSKSAFK